MEVHFFFLYIEWSFRFIEVYMFLSSEFVVCPRKYAQLYCYVPKLNFAENPIKIPRNFLTLASTADVLVRKLSIQAFDMGTVPGLVTSELV